MTVSFSNQCGVPTGVESISSSLELIRQNPIECTLANLGEAGFGGRIAVGQCLRDEWTKHRVLSNGYKIHPNGEDSLYDLIKQKKLLDPQRSSFHLLKDIVRDQKSQRIAPFFSIKAFEMLFGQAVDLDDCAASLLYHKIVALNSVPKEEADISESRDDVVLAVSIHEFCLAAYKYVNARRIPEKSAIYEWVIYPILGWIYNFVRFPPDHTYDRISFLIGSVSVANGASQIPREISGHIYQIVDELGSRMKICPITVRLP